MQPFIVLCTLVGRAVCIWCNAWRKNAGLLILTQMICSFYLEEGFLHLQDAVGQSIIEFLANKTISIQLSVEVSSVIPLSIKFSLYSLSSAISLSSIPCGLLSSSCWSIPSPPVGYSISLFCWNFCKGKLISIGTDKNISAGQKLRNWCLKRKVVSVRPC